MIDLKLLERDFEYFALHLNRKGIDKGLLESLRSLAENTKKTRQELEEKQALQNSLSREFGKKKASGEDTEAMAKELSTNKEQMQKLVSQLNSLTDQLDSIALNIPNLPDQNVPDGKDENENVELSKVLTPRSFDFKPKAHYELEGLLDFDSGVKLSGSRFVVMRGIAAKIERALISYMLDFNSARGFDEVWLPVMVTRESLTATGQLPKFEEDLYQTQKGEEAKHDLFLIPTSEVPLLNIYRDTIVKEEDLPIKLTAHSLCFRKEAGSAGRDTRGMIRQHQFDKVELVVISKPDESDRMFDEMVQTASDLLTSLELPHRLVSLCTGDLGFAAAKTTDLEVWIPSEDRYREISSVSNTRDFQTRRAKIRFKDGKKNSLAHALNGSSLAVGRTLIALLENHQRDDGTINIPEVLMPYMNRS